MIGFKRIVLVVYYNTVKYSVVQQFGFGLWVAFFVSEQFNNEQHPITKSIVSKITHSLISDENRDYDFKYVLLWDERL